MKLILIIEAETNHYSDMESIFQGHRMRVILTTLKKRLIDYIKSADPDIIVLVFSKNIKNELEFVFGLKKDPFTENIPILAVLPEEDENFIFNHKILGFTDYLVKPFPKSLILEKVQSIIKEYTGFKKYKADSIDSHIEIHSQGFRTTIYLRSSLSHYVAPEIKETFSKSMLNKLKDDTICIDLRGLFLIQKTELRILEQIIGLFEGKPVYLIGGKYTGFLVESGFGQIGTNLFVTPEECHSFLSENNL